MALQVGQFRQIIVANECGGNPRVALRFEDPDGERSGKSGWSFGICQFDLSNNPLASTCLAECGFTAAEIAGLKAQTIDPKPLEAKLRAGAAIIAKWDTRQLAGCLDRATNILYRHGITPADDTALLAVADYDNQYYLSDINKPGYLVNYLSTRGRSITAEDVLRFKLDHTAYGKKRPGDCQRRYDNLIRITGGHHG